MQIAVDGPAGVGKSTVARLLAERLGALYVNTGAMYRALAWGVRQGLPLEEIRIELDPQGKVWVNGNEVGEELYTPELDRWASRLAARPEVRRRLIALQRELAAARDVVMEGRDIGTVVLPQADLKLYLVASLEERARRRARQRGEPLEWVRRALAERDARDAQGFERRPAPDAVTIDTERLSAEAVVEQALAYLKKREGAGKL